VVEGGDHDLGAQAHVVVHLSGEAGQNGHGLEPSQVPVQEVLADADVADAVLLGRVHDPEHVRKLLARWGRRRDVG